jgi:hypothetical protein
MILFLHGAIMTGCAACGLFFVRFWKTSRDRLFLWFAFAFWVMAFERVMLALVHPRDEFKPYVFLIRLVAFAMIVVAIVDKNRARR